MNYQRHSQTEEAQANKDTWAIINGILIGNVLVMVLSVLIRLN